MKKSGCFQQSSSAQLGEQTSTGQSYKYTGKPFDDEGGFDLYYYGARYYDRAGQRFISVDPLHFFEAGQSPYVYAGGNPIAFIDYNGLAKAVAATGVGGRRTDLAGRTIYEVSWDTKVQPADAFKLIPAWGSGLSIVEDHSNEWRTVERENGTFEVITANQEKEKQKDVAKVVAEYGIGQWAKELGASGLATAVITQFVEVCMRTPDPKWLVEAYNKRYGRHTDEWYMKNPKELGDRLRTLVSEYNRKKEAETRQKRTTAKSRSRSGDNWEEYDPANR